MNTASAQCPGLAARQRGFTLLEIMVVIAIVALLSAGSVLALRQAGDRPHMAEAGRIQAWMQQLADRALLEGVAYGMQLDVAPGGDKRLQPLVFYRYQWYPLAEPEALQLASGTSLLLPSAGTDAGDTSGLPAVMLSEGAMLPDENLYLSFAGTDLRLALQWQTSRAKLELEPAPSSGRAP